jgi:hypothetical protein
MASTYTTGFGIEKIGSGEQSGTWGTTTNHNLDIVDRIASYKAVGLSGTTHTLTVREASPGSGTENLQDGMYRVIKFTGALGANNTVTIAPNTSPAWFIIENATTDSGSSGPYSVILTQGSGANVTVQNGKNAIIYCDGAGSGAVVYDALADIQVGTLEVTGAAAIDGALTQGGASQFNSTVTVGVNDTGYDVKLFGATSGAYMLWDESADDLKLVGAAGLTVATTALVTGVLTTTATQVATGGITSGSDIISDTDSTDDLGTTGVRWANLFVDAITATDQVTATGFTGTLDGILGSGTPAAATVTTAGIGMTPVANYGILQVGSAVTSALGVGGLQAYVAGTNSALGQNGNVSIVTTDGQAANIGGSIGLGGKFVASGLSVLFAHIAGRKENGTDNNSAGYLQFATQPNGGTPTERARITSAGLLGLGTTAPSARIDSTQNQAALSYLLDTNNTTHGGGSIWRMITRNIANSGTTSVDFYKPTGSGFNLLNNDTHASNFTAFGLGGVERMRITPTGVGIGTTSGGAKLSVYAGNIGVDGNGSANQFYGAAGNVAGTNTTGGVLTVLGHSPNATGDLAAPPYDGTNFVGAAGLMARGFSESSQYRGSLEFFTKTASAANATSRMLITHDGSVVIGPTNGTVTLAPGGAGGGSILVFNKPNTGATNVVLNYYGSTYVGGINMDNTSTAFLTSSDERLKENITDSPSSIESIIDIKIRSFDWINDSSSQIYGIIAQEVKLIAPECVSEGQTPEDTWGVDYSKLTPRLIKAIQEQQATIEALTARITALEG